MGSLFYNLLIAGMGLAIRLAALFNRKARLWVRGRRGIFERLAAALDRGEGQRDDIAWFHAASLGEFEQGRPVIEAFREKYPDHKILLTFFSPSGYEMRKDYPGADWVFYLPADSARNARRFVRIVRPEVAVFIKYEFWSNYLRQLHRSGARIFSISAIFSRRSRFFSRWYGRRYRRLLACFEHIFVQDEPSRRRLRAVGIDRVTVAGDTRFDRVAAIAESHRELPLLDAFAAGGAPLFMAGSTWPPDDELILKLIADAPEARFVIAPHNIHEDRVERLIAACRRKAVRYTHLKSADDLTGVGVLIVDTVGILSAVYRYGRYGWIGGGFGAGIHNTLEAAVFGLPVAFGPNWHAFREAADLIACGGAAAVRTYSELLAWYTALRDDPAAYARASNCCRDYVENGRGATEIILRMI